MYRPLFPACLFVCWFALTGCARGALNEGGDGGGGGAATSGGNEDSGHGGDDGGHSTQGGDAGSTNGAATDGGTTAADSGASSGGDASANAGDCSPLPSSCDMAEAASLGELDASDSNSKVMRMGAGSGWLAVDLRDGNKAAQSNIQIGLSALLSAPAGTGYSMEIVGDTSPDGGGRCVAADVTDTDPLSKTAIWGSYGPNSSKTRSLSIHIEQLSGTCAAQWTLTVQGNPCASGGIGFGEDSLGSCP